MSQRIGHPLGDVLAETVERKSVVVVVVIVVVVVVVIVAVEKKSVASVDQLLLLLLLLLLFCVVQQSLPCVRCSPWIYLWKNLISSGYKEDKDSLYALNLSVFEQSHRLMQFGRHIFGWPINGPLCDLHKRDVIVVIEMKLKWNWNEIEMKMKWNWNEIEMKLKWNWNWNEIEMK